MKKPLPQTVRIYLMKKAYFTLVVVLICLNAMGQNDGKITIGKIDSLYSEVLDEQRKIWIHVPSGIYNNESQSQKYPVLYLLDGKSNFYSTIGITSYLSTSNRNTVLPKMIVVGILNTDRVRDFTPSKGNFLDGTVAEKSGGGANFIEFIEKELIPYIESNYPTESYRTLIGHSLGGLTVMNTLMTKPELFNSYAAIDPSMWWNDKKFLQSIITTKLPKTNKTLSIFLGIANTFKIDTSAVKNDTSTKTIPVRAMLELHSYFEDIQTKTNLNYKGKFYQDENHITVGHIAIYDALRFIFKFHQLEFSDHELKDTNQDIIARIKKHYENVSLEYGRPIQPKRYFIESLANKLVEMKLYEKAESLFRYNISVYPDNSYAHNILGDFLIIRTHKKEAIEIFKQSYAIDQNSYARDKIKVLKIN